MKKLLKNMSIYGIGGVIAKAIQFLLLPVYTRVLVPAEYGSLELVYMVANVIAVLYGFMISSGYLRNYYDIKEKHHREVLLGSAFWFTFFSSLFFGIFSIAFAEDIAGIVFKFDNGGRFIVLITISTAIMAHNRIFYNLLMVREAAKKYVAVNITTLLIMMGITVYFVVFLRWGVLGILVAQVTAYTTEFVILSVLMLRKTIFKFSIKVIKEMLEYSIPLIPLQLAAFILTLSDRFFLQEYKTLDEVGLYSLGYKFAAIIPLIAIEPFKAFGPHIFNLVDNPEKCKRTLADMCRYYMAGILLITLVISMFSREIIMIMSEKNFYSGYRVVYLLCLSYVFYGLSNLAGYAINIVKKNWIITVSWIMAAGINIFLNFLLIPKYGMIGASVATVVSYLIIVLIKFIAVKYVYPTSFRYSYFISVFILTTAVYGLSTLADYGIAASILIKIGLLSGFVMAIYYSGYFTSDERDKAKELLRFRYIKRPSENVMEAASANRKPYKELVKKTS